MIILTGGSGKLGRVVFKHLLDHGYDVVNVNSTLPPEGHSPRFSRVDVTDFGQVMAALSGIDERSKGVTGVVHLAAIPAPGWASNHVTFSVNTVSTYNVFEAARQLKIRNVVWASSETVFGIPFDKDPTKAPLDETIRSPETAYSLSKALGEEMAEHFCRWDAETKIIGLRFSNVMEPQDYAKFDSFDADAKARKWNLWTYIDARDGAQAVRRALEAPLKGAHVFGIANADSVMRRDNNALLKEVYPNVKPSRAVQPNESLIAIEKAKRMLGYEPKYSWRDPASHKA